MYYDECHGFNEAKKIFEKALTYLPDNTLMNLLYAEYLDSNKQPKVSFTSKSVRPRFPTPPSPHLLLLVVFNLKAQDRFSLKLKYKMIH